MSLQHYLILGSFLFCLGLVAIISRRNAIISLLGIELLFNAANVNLVAFAKFDYNVEGQVFALFILIIAACETAIGLVLLMQVYKYFKTINLDALNTQGEED